MQEHKLMLCTKVQSLRWGKIWTNSNSSNVLAVPSFKHNNSILAKIKNFWKTQNVSKYRNIILVGSR